MKNNLIDQIGRNWGWLLTVGILLVILGTAGLGATFMVTLTAVTFFGFLLLIGGVFQFLDAFRYKNWKTTIWNLLIALLYIAGGVIMIRDPALASAGITLLIAWALVAIGIMRIMYAIQMRGASGWFWVLLAGFAAIALGIMVINQWPVSGLWVIGMFVAIDLIFNGWSMIMVALAARKLGRFAREL